MNQLLCTENSSTEYSSTRVLCELSPGRNIVDAPPPYKIFRMTDGTSPCYGNFIHVMTSKSLPTLEQFVPKRNVKVIGARGSRLEARRFQRGRFQLLD
jgi:hypothetical protein